MKENKSLLTKIGCACCSAGSTLTSLGCMAIMATAIGTTGAVTLGSMGAMSMSSPINTFPSVLLNFLGLGSLTRVNLRTLEIILIFLLSIGIISMYLSYKYHKNSNPLILFVISSILIYVSIFVVMSNALYYISLIGLIVTPIWNFYVKTNKV